MQKDRHPQWKDAATSREGPGRSFGKRNSLSRNGFQQILMVRAIFPHVALLIMKVPVK
jgi:hypothetical protein